MRKPFVIIIIVIVAALWVAAGIYYFTRSRPAGQILSPTQDAEQEVIPSLLPQAKDPETTAIKPGLGLATYKTLQGGFSVSYPERFSVKNIPQERSIAGTVLDRYYSEAGELGFISIYIPQNEFPNTNFSEAEINISATGARPCDLSRYSEGLNMTGTAEIAGREFNKFLVTDAAAGNLHSTTIYARAEGDRCYAIEEVIHTTNIQNYDPFLGVRVYDEIELRKLLNSIIKSFNLTSEF